MARTGITLKGRLFTGCAVFVLLTLIVGVMGLDQFRTVSRQMATVRQVNRCVDAACQIQSFQQLFISNPLSDASAEQTVDVWKKAKDKFLKEIKRLSQTPGLGEAERNIVRDIEDSWKNYDISFRKYILARNEDRAARAREMRQALSEIQGAEGLQSLSAIADASAERTIHQAGTILVLITALAVMAGVILSLILVRHVPGAIRAIVKRLQNASLPPSASGSPEQSIDNQIRNVENLVQDLNNLLGGKEHAQDKEPETHP